MYVAKQINMSTIMEKVKRKNNQAWAIRYQDVVEAQKLSEEAYSLAKDLNDIHGQALALRTLSYCLAANNIYDQAMEMGLQSIALLEQLNDQEDLAFANNVVSHIHWDLGDYSSALEYNFQTLLLAQAIGNRRLEALTYNNIAMNHARLQNFAQVDEMLPKALVIFQELNDIRHIVMTYNNLAMLHVSTNDYQQALVDALQGWQLLQKTDNEDKHTEADDGGDTDQPVDDMWDIQVDMLDTLGQIYTKLTEYDKALQYLYLAESIAKDNALKWHQAYAQLNIGQIYQSQQHYGNAIQQATNALTIGEVLESPQLLLECHELLAAVHQSNGDFEQALVHHQTFHELHNNIFSEDRDRHFALLEVRYRTESARKEALAYQEKNQELAEINAILEELHQEKDDLMRIVAHDLRSPLSGIKMSIDLLKDYGERLTLEKRQQKLIRIDSSVSRMIDIISNLLEDQASSPKVSPKTFPTEPENRPFLAMAQGPGVTDVEPIQLSPILQRIYEQHKPGADAKKITLQIHWDESLQAMFLTKSDPVKSDPVKSDPVKSDPVKSDPVKSDPTGSTEDLDLSVQSNLVILGNRIRLEQVLDNLLSNAIKYSYASSTVTVRISPHDAHVQIAVEDQGQGLSDEDKKHVFGRYSKLSAKPTGGESSVGLGLYSAKKLIEAMNGLISVESPGKSKGSVFSISLPTP